MSWNTSHNTNMHRQSGVSGTVPVAFLWYLPSLVRSGRLPPISLPITSQTCFYFMKKYSLLVVCSTARIVFLHLINTVHCFLWELSTNFLSLFVFSFFPETKTKGLASSWRLYFRTLGIDHHGFLQNIWNQAHETCLLNWSKQDTCIGCYFGFMGITRVLCMWIMFVLKHCVDILLLKVLLKSSLLPLFMERF